MCIFIGITTKDRPEYLKKSLENIKENTTLDYRLLIVDDNSTQENKEKNRQIIKDLGLDCTYHYNKTNIGIAKSKNICLEKGRDLKNLFLFDDDCYPKQKGWENFFIDSSFFHLLRLDNASKLDVKKVFEYPQVDCYDKALGCFMYISNKLIKAIGGFNTEYGKYGLEHADYSVRYYFWQISKHIQTEEAFLCLPETKDYIHSIDIDENTNYSTISDEIKQNVKVELYEKNIKDYQSLKNLYKPIIY